MPEISRFFGIVVRMFMEVGAPHHRPHFHASYQDVRLYSRLIPSSELAALFPGPSKDSSRPGPESTVRSYCGTGSSCNPVSLR